MGKIKRKCMMCGEEFEVYPSLIKRGGGKYCSISCGTTFRNLHNNPTKDHKVRRKISENHANVSGENNPMYGKKGNLAPSYIDGRSSMTGDTWRKIAFVNKKRQCGICGEKEVSKLHVHHKDKKRTNNELDNLQVVCASCHNNILHLKKRDDFGRYIKEEILDGN